MVAPYLDKVLHKYSGAGRDVRQARRALQLKLRELRFPIRLAHRLGRRRDFGDARQRFTGQQTQPSDTIMLQLHGRHSILAQEMRWGPLPRISRLFVEAHDEVPAARASVCARNQKAARDFQGGVLDFVSKEQWTAGHGQASPEVADELRDTPSLHLRVYSFCFGSCEANRLAHAQEPHDIR